MLPSVTQTTSASRIIRISGLITFTFRLWPGIPSPQLHTSLLPGWVWGSVLRWWLTFPQVGFSPTGEYELCSAHLCNLVVPTTCISMFMIISDSRHKHRSSYRYPLSCAQCLRNWFQTATEVGKPLSRASGGRNADIPLCRT